jgi:tripartite-type tricarboxylate transporter receptor subunit TctC
VGLIGASKKTPAAIIEMLNKEINAVVTGPNVKTRLVGSGVEPTSMTPADFGKLIAGETEKSGKVARFAGIKVD